MAGAAQRFAVHRQTAPPARPWRRIGRILGLGGDRGQVVQPAAGRGGERHRIQAFQGVPERGPIGYLVPAVERVVPDPEHLKDVVGNVTDPLPDRRQ